MAGAVAFGTPTPVKKPVASATVAAVDPFQPTVGSTGLTQAQINQSNLYRQQTEDATRAKQAELNAAEDRARRIAAEDEEAARQRQLFANQMAQVSAAPSYASSSASASHAAPAQAPVPLDINALVALKQAVMPAPVAPPSYAASNAVADDAFARAKDKAGLLALRRTADAQTNAARRGLTGSGIEAKMTDDILTDTAGALTDVATEQAKTQAQRGYDTADRDYAGAIQQRGQELSIIPTLLSLIDRQRYY